uniref:Uncharacterized protein n=1 Tax=Romanomermis culicivorax TaxID=13658 RepID=A0A915HKD4_ROMCU
MYKVICLFIIWCIFSGKFSRQQDEQQLKRFVDDDDDIIGWLRLNTLADTIQSDPASKCAYDCAAILHIPKNVLSLVTLVIDQVTDSENATNFAALFNSSIIQEYCDYASARQSCINTCPSSEWKSNLVNFFSVWSTICDKQSNFHPNIDCFHKVHKEDKSGCKSAANCGDRQIGKLVKLYDEQPQLMESWKETAQWTFNHTCEYLKCDVRCRSEEMSKQCGQTATQVFNEVVKEILSSAKTFHAFIYQVFHNDTINYIDDCN